MNRLFKRLLTFALLVTCGWAVWAMWPNEAKRIRSLIRELVADASFAAQDGPIVRAVKVQSIVARLTADAEVQFDAFGIPVREFTGREEIREIVAASRGLEGGLAVDVHDIEVILGPEADQATAALTASARSGSNELVAAQEFELSLVKQERKWFIRRVRTVRTLQK